MLQTRNICKTFLFLLLTRACAATDLLTNNCENGDGDCSGTVFLPELEDEDARGVLPGMGMGYRLLSYLSTSVPASQGTGRNKPLKFRFRFPYFPEPTKSPFTPPTWEIKDRLGYPEPPIWGPREPKRGKKTPEQKARQEPLRRGPPILQMRSSDEIEDFNERKYQAYAEYYGLPYKSDRDAPRNKKRNKGSSKNKNSNKKQGTPNPNYSVEGPTNSCEEGRRGCVKYYDSHGLAHVYENHPFSQSEEIIFSTPAPVAKRKKNKSRPKVTKRRGQKKPAAVTASVDFEPPQIVSSYSINKRKKNNKRNSNKRKKLNRRKGGQNSSSQQVGSVESHDDSLEGVDRDFLQSLYNRNNQRPRVTYKIKGENNVKRRVPYVKIPKVPSSDY